MKKIKVLNIMTSVLDYNGIGMSLLNYYNNIDPKVIQMDFLVPNIVDEKLKKEFTKHKSNNVFEFEMINGKKMHQKNPLLYAKKLYQLIKEEKYNIVHAHGSSSMLCLQLITAKLAGVKVRIAHSRNTSSDHNFLNFLLKPLFKRSYTNAFACGKEAGEWLFGKNKEVMYINNGKDFSLFSYKENIRDEIRKEYNLENQKIIGHIGNFNYQKNHEFLINVFEKIIAIDKNYHMFLAGSGPLETDIKEMVKNKKLEDKIHFLGQIPVNRVAELLNAFDIMLLPSRFEGFPNVLIEWQMNGLPCIIADTITRDCSITDLVQFLPIKNESDEMEWAKSVLEYNYKDRKKLISEMKRKTSEAGFNIEENARILQKKYIELINEGGRK